VTPGARVSKRSIAGTGTCYSTEAARFPAWFSDRSLLPKDPVPRIVARLRAAGVLQ